MAHALRAPGFGGTLSPHLRATAWRACMGSLRHPIKHPLCHPSTTGLGVCWGPWHQSHFPGDRDVFQPYIVAIPVASLPPPGASGRDLPFLPSRPEEINIYCRSQPGRAVLTGVRREAAPAAGRAAVIRNTSGWGQIAGDLISTRGGNDQMMSSTGRAGGGARCRGGVAAWRQGFASRARDTELAPSAGSRALHP